MNQERELKLKLKLKLKLSLLFITIISIALGIMGLINFQNAKETIVKNKIIELSIISDLKGREIRRFFEELERVITITQSRDSIKTNLPTIIQFFRTQDSVEFHQAQEILDDELKVLLKERNFYNIFLLNPEGKIVYALNKINNAQILGQGLIDPSHKAFAEGQIDVYFSEIFKDRTPEIPYSMLVTAPVYDRGGRFTGEIAFEVDMNPIYELIQDISGLGNTGETLVGQRAGDAALYIHPLKYDPYAAFNRKVYYNEKKGIPMQKATLGESGTGLTLDYRSVPVIASWQSIFVTKRQWGLVTKIDQREAFIPIYHLRDGFIIMFLIIFFLSMVIVFVNATAITEPLEKLTQMATAISKGNLNARVKDIYAKDEVGELAQAFNQMIDDLQKTTVARDELIKAQEQTQKALRELQESQAVTLNIMEDLKEETEVRKKAEEELKRSNQELEQFAYVASHDLQEPVRMVTSYAQLLEGRYKDKLDGAALDFLKFIVDGGKRMQTLVNDLLTYSRVGTKAKPFAKTDMNAIFDIVIDNLKLLIEDKNAKVTKDFLPIVIADDVQMGQLLQNLIGNAIKYQLKEQIPKVHISAKKNDTHWLFSVKDNGIGIDPKYFNRLFVMFQRLHQRDEYSGTGIGLVACKKIVERHGGRIWVESELGKGATFYFEIPEKNKESKA